MGREYVIDHSILALKEKYKKDAEERSFKVYLTDALMIIAENTTHQVGYEGVVDIGRSFKKRWIELFEETEEPQREKEPEKEDTRTTEEIVSDMWLRIKG